MGLNKRLRHDYDYCLNCKKPLEVEDDFCARCGQKRMTGRISFRQLVFQFFEDTFNWDARLFRSIRGLFMPGFLTKEYFSGRHVPYWQPLRLFLFMAALQMIVVNATMNKVNEQVVRANDSIKQSLHESIFLKKMDTLKTKVLPFFHNKKVAKAAMDSLLVACAYPERFTHAPKEKVDISAKIDSFKKTIIPKIRKDMVGEDSLEIEDEITSEIEKFAEKFETKENSQNLNTFNVSRLADENIEIPFASVREALTPNVKTDTVKHDLHIGWNTNSFKQKNATLSISKHDFLTLSPDSIMNKYYVDGFWNQVIAKQTIKVMKDGKSGIDFFLSRLSWMIIIMMPVFALFLELVNRKYHYVEHVIFSFHCHAFMFFLISFLFFIQHTIIPASWSALGIPINSLAMLGLLYYFYKAMRNVYQQGRFKTALKYSFLLVAYFFSMLFAVIFTIIISFFLF